MSALEALAAAGPVARPIEPGAAPAALAAAPPNATVPVDFGTLLAQGIGALDAKVAHADAMVARFAVDDSVPVHQVTVALEEAKLSLEFAMQVRARLAEGYQQLMNMQL